MLLENVKGGKLISDDGGRGRERSWGKEKREKSVGGPGPENEKSITVILSIQREACRLRSIHQDHAFLLLLIYGITCIDYT